MHSTMLDIQAGERALAATAPETALTLLGQRLCLSANFSVTSLAIATGYHLDSTAESGVVAPGARTSTEFPSSTEPLARSRS
jgi:hypothetical protein